MKKVLFITLDFPPNIGGVSAYYENICKRLGPQSLIVLTQITASAAIQDSSLPYKIIRGELISHKKFVWPKWIGLLGIIEKIIKENNIQAILVGNILPVGEAVYLLNKKIKLPYYIFAHGMDISILRGRKRIIARNIIHKSSGMFCNSNFTRHLIEGFGYPNNKICTVYPCPNIIVRPQESIVSAIKNTYNLYDKKILLTVGRLVERKGHDKVIESLPNILRKHNDAVYIIAGDGPDEKRLKRLVEKYKVKNNVIFINHPDNEQIAALYDISTVFIMPSRALPNGDIEGFGTVFLEAAMYSLPSVAGKSGGVQEAVIDNVTGKIVEPESRQEIETAILKLLDNPSLAHIYGLQGLERAHRLFSWDKETKKIQNVIG